MSPNKYNKFAKVSNNNLTLNATFIFLSFFCHFFLAFSLKLDITLRITWEIINPQIRHNLKGLIMHILMEELLDISRSNLLNLLGVEMLLLHGFD